ncbi:MAG TPA: glycosyltransferase family 2 protein [Solirubrobacterales bacterium]|nr:glycosyltransferase family 2 protein [Solirubrobacterales bacterium]
MIPLVSVVVVNYNGADAIGRCLNALVADTGDGDFEVLVVDNASSDGSDEIAEAMAEEHGSVRLIRSPTNRGYAGAVDVALAEARGTHVAVLNMDVVVGFGWLEPLVAFLEATPDAGAVCPLIVLESDPSRINAAGQDVHVTGLGFNRWLEEPRERAGAGPFRVSGLHGAAFLIRRDLFESIGGWDESGFLYHEDVELSWLLQVAGREIYCVPASTVSHDYHLTMFPHKLFLLERNRWSMLLANTRLPTRIALSPLFLLSELMMWGYCLLRGPSFLRAKLDSYRWISGNRERIRGRRRFVESLRRRSDWSVVRRLHWGYPVDQFLTLGRERGESERDRIGG